MVVVAIVGGSVRWDGRPAGTAGRQTTLCSGSSVFVGDGSRPRATAEGEMGSGGARISRRASRYVVLVQRGQGNRLGGLRRRARHRPVGRCRAISPLSSLPRCDDSPRWDAAGWTTARG